MRSKADETLVIVETLICPLEIIKLLTVIICGRINRLAETNLCIMNLLFSLLLWMTSTIFQPVFLAMSFQKWQCSFTENGTVFELFHRPTEPFQTIGYPAWMTENRKYVNCFQKGLKHIPQDLRTDTEVIDLAQNSIGRIQKNDFDKYRSLVAISIINNCVIVDFTDDGVRRCLTYFSVETAALINLHHLKYLALDGNVMKQFPVMLPKSLLIVLASMNSFGPIQKHDLQYLTSLEIIIFSMNCLVADLKHFCLGNFTIDGPFFSSPNLKFLDLSYNNFRKVPSYLFQPSLLGIKLHGNPIHRIESQDFANSPNVTYLDVAWTSQYIEQPMQIDGKALYPLTNLETLNLDGNMISNLSKNFFSKNCNLKYLNLAFNCLKFVETNPDILPSLPLLEELYLAGNSFCDDTPDPVQYSASKLKLGKSFLGFPNLTTLSIGMVNAIPNAKFTPSKDYYSLYGIKYDRVDEDSFEVLKKLPQFQKLAVTTSGVRLFDTSAFAGLNLTYLDFSFNRIGEISKYMNYVSVISNLGRAKPSTNWERISYIRQTYANSNNFYKLQTKSPPHYATSIERRWVKLSHNSISNLKQYPLKYFNFGTHIDFSYNQIHYIFQDTFQGLSNLKFIDLQYNPIRFVNPQALFSLPQLTDLKFKFVEHAEEFSLTFLLNISCDLRVKIVCGTSVIYRLLQYYGNKAIYFSKVRSIDVSHIHIPTNLVSTNKPIFAPLPNLIELKMDEAHLTFYPQSNFFHGLSKLQNLSMRDCWLEFFPFNASKTLFNLTYFDLSYNKIEILDKNLIPKFPKLKYLIISHNLIHTITSDTLTVLQANGLSNIDLRHNRISNIGPSVVSRSVLSNMSLIDLRGNNIHCTCSLRETFGWLVYSSEKPISNSRLPGFIPECSFAVISYSIMEAALSVAMAIPTNHIHYSLTVSLKTVKKTFCYIFPLCFC